MIRFGWAKKAASNWLSLLTAADLKGIPWVSEGPVPVVLPSVSSPGPRFPPASVLAHLELGSVLSVPRRRRS